MTLRREFEVVETPRGTGQVRRKGEVIAKVNYQLTVETVDVIARSFQGVETPVAAHKSVSGQLSLLEGELAADGSPSDPSGPLTLILEDGREVDFYFESRTVKSQPTRQEYTIKGSGNRL